MTPPSFIPEREAIAERAQCGNCDGELVLLVDDRLGLPWIGRTGLFMCHCEECGVVGVRDPRIVDQARHVPMASRRFWVEKPTTKGRPQ